MAQSNNFKHLLAEQFSPNNRLNELYAVGFKAFAEDFKKTNPNKKILVGFKSAKN